MLVEELLNREVHVDVAVVNQERFIRVDKRHDLAQTAAGIQRLFLVAESYRDPAVLRIGEGKGAFPHELQVGSVDNEFLNSGADKVIHHVLDQRLLKNGKEGLRYDGREGSQASTETGAENESLHDSAKGVRVREYSWRVDDDELVG